MHWTYDPQHALIAGVFLLLMLLFVLSGFLSRKDKNRRNRIK